MKTRIALQTLTLAVALALPAAAYAETQTGMPRRDFAVSIQGPRRSRRSTPRPAR